MLKLTFLFAIGSFSGWCIEVIYRSIICGAFVNPGLLHGPYLPIYGFGFVLLYLIAECTFVSRAAVPRYTIQIIAIGVGMTLLEYIAGCIFIKGMGIPLWDYSHRWGNIQGLICPTFSAIWTIMGAAYVLLLHKHLKKVVAWFDRHKRLLFLSGIFVGMTFLDLIYTLRMP